MEKANRSVLIDLTTQMIQRYSAIPFEGKNCIICDYFDGLDESHKCNSCFNRIDRKELCEINDDLWIAAGCTSMKTFPAKKDDNKYRLIYWQKVLEYLNSLYFEDVFLGQLRYRCNQIDQKII